MSFTIIAADPCERVGAEKVRNEELGVRNGGGGAQIGKRRLMKYSRALPHECLHPQSSSRAVARELDS